MMETAPTSVLSTVGHSGTGGFLDPDRIVGGFGVEEGMRIADFGCGSGYFTVILAEKVGPSGKVYALDILESALDMIRAKAHAHGLENMEIIRANLEVLGGSGLADSSQNMVLMANILFQSSKKKDIIREGARVLKNGGKMIVIDWDSKSKVNGLGPPDGIRPDKLEVKSTIESEGLVFEKELDAGKFHFGLIFKKP